MSVTVRAPEDDSERAAAFAVRHTVFVLEQGVPVEEELDDRDETADHLIAITDEGTVVGTCRILRDDEATARIGRMAVLAEHVPQYGREGAVTAQEFYRRSGFVAHGDVFLDAGIEHIAMTKQLA